MKDMVEKRSFEEFNQTGLILFVNQFLNIFGWALAFELDDKGKIKGIFPCRTKFRGYEEAITLESYKMVSKYMSEHGKELEEEVL